jgi:hypothetical protein
VRPPGAENASEESAACVPSREVLCALHPGTEGHDNSAADRGERLRDPSVGLAGKNPFHLIEIAGSDENIRNKEDVCFRFEQLSS